VYPTRCTPIRTTCAVAIFGAEDSNIWHDRKGARLNAIRNRTLIADADIVVIRFGEKYKQWNAAFDAGCAVTLGKPIITLHPSEHDHALKEIDDDASAVAGEPRQVVQALAYIIGGDMPASTKEAYATE
jgi:YtoQ family protein